MFIIHGAYHFWPKQDAFRNDYCLSCQAPRRSIAVRSFDVGHIFWIPILPVGFWRHWKCTVCGRDPHRGQKKRRSLLWTAWCAWSPCRLMLWIMPAAADLGIGAWIFRIAAPAAAILLFIRLLRVPRAPSLRRDLPRFLPPRTRSARFVQLRWLQAPMPAGPAPPATLSGINQASCLPRRTAGFSLRSK